MNHWQFIIAWSLILIPIIYFVTACISRDSSTFFIHKEWLIKMLTAYIILMTLLFGIHLLASWAMQPAPAALG